MNLTEDLARQELARRYFRSVGAARLTDCARLFSWRPPDAEKAIAALCEEGAIVASAHPKDHGEWFAVPEVFSS